MAKKKTVSDLSKSGQVNSFTGGINTDLHPMLQPNDTLTDCLNGTLITYNGNENMLQNDMGNYELKHAQLPEGYIPMGMREYQGVLYIASWNPFEKKAQIGSYPSPRTIFGDNIETEYVIEPLQINSFDLTKDYYRDSKGLSKIDNVCDADNNPGDGLSEIVFMLSAGKKLYYYEDSEYKEYNTNHLVSKIDYSKSEVIFTDNFSEETTIGMGDRYFLQVDNIESSEFQTFRYFILDKNKNKHDVTNYINSNFSDEKFNLEQLESYTPVTFEHNGWLGGRYSLSDANIEEVSIEITKNEETLDNILSKIETNIDDVNDLHDVKQIYHDGASSEYISTIFSDGQPYIYPKEVVCENPIEIKNTYEQGVQSINDALNPYIGDDFITVVTLGTQWKQPLNYENKIIQATGAWRKPTVGDYSYHMYKLCPEKFELSFVELFGSLHSNNQELVALFIPSKFTLTNSELNTYNPTYMISKIVFLGDMRFNLTRDVFRGMNIKSIDFVGYVAPRILQSLTSKSDNQISYNLIRNINVISQYNNSDELIDGITYNDNIEYNWRDVKAAANSELPYVGGNAQCYRYGDLKQISIDSSFVSIHSKSSIELTIRSESSYILEVPEVIIKSEALVTINYLWFKNAANIELLRSIKIKNLISKSTLNITGVESTLENLYCTNGVSDNAYKNMMLSGEKILFTTSSLSANQDIDLRLCDWIKVFNKDSWIFINNKENVKTLILPASFSEGVELKPIFPKLEDIYYYGYRYPYIPWKFSANNPQLHVLPVNLSYYERKQHWLKPTTVTFENQQTVSYGLQLSLPLGYDLVKNFALKNNTKTYIISKHGTNVLRDVNRVVTKNDNTISCYYDFGFPSILSEEEFPYNEKYDSIACYSPCTVPSNISNRTDKWYLDKNCTIILSSSKKIYNIYLTNVESEEDIINFCDNIVVDSEDSYNINIYSSYSDNVINYVPRYKNIEFSFDNTSIDIIKENTIVYTGNFSDKNISNYCNTKLVGTIDNNVYEINFSSENPNSESIIEALNRLPKDVTKNSILLFPNTTSQINIESEHPMMHVFVPSTSDIPNISAIDTIDSYITGVGLIGDYDSSYMKCGWDWGTNHDCGTHELLLTLSGTNLQDPFGVLFKTLVINDTGNSIITKNISTTTGIINKYPVDECLITTQTHNNINIELEEQKNIYTALQILSEDGEDKYVSVNNKFSGELSKSDSYTINAYHYKYIDGKLLIFDTNKKSWKSGVSEIKSDLLAYKYYVSEDHLMHIYLEFSQILDNRNANWRILDLENQLLFGNTVSEEFSNKINITVDIRDNTVDVGMFEYYVNGVVYKKPIFLKNKLTSLDQLNYSDYSQAYYDDLTQFTPKFEVKLEDISEKFPSCGGKIQLAQRTQKTGNVEKFTHDSRYNIEKRNGTWWNMTEKLISGEGDTYLGTRLYKNISFNLSDMCFVKGRTSFSVSINAEGYDKELLLRPDSIYTSKDDSTFKCEIPVVETKRKIYFKNDCVPFVRRYLVQDTYPMIGNTKLFNTNNEDLDNENLSILTKVCDWGTPKMLFIDKAAGENNDCTIAWADSTKYSKDADCFSNGDYCSGEGDIKNYVWDKLKSIFVPVIVRIKSSDNGFVFPIPRNKNWTYKWKYIEARGKKNSDNKRNLTKNGISSIVCTKNNMAAAIANLILGIGELLATVALWIGVAAASVGAIILSGGAGIGLVTTTVAMSATTLISVSSALFGLGCAQFSAGLAELLKKEKTFKLLAIRGNNTLLLPLLGEQSNSNKFPAQARYETETKEGDFSFDKIEQMMFYLGSRLYAKDYMYPGGITSEYYKKPVWAEEHSQTVNYTLTIKATNVEIQTNSGFSIEVLDKTFLDIYGISTNNFKTKNSIPTTWTTKFSAELLNMWESDDWKGLEKQTSKDCITNIGDSKIGDYNDVYSNVDTTNTLMHNLITCIKYHPGTKHFFYHEINNEGEIPEYVDDLDTGKWRINDNKWAFGPNRGGAAIRLLRNYWKGDKKSKKDHDYICNGEYPVFNSQISTPIARPIIPVDLRDEGSGYEYKEKDGVDIRSNYFNSYNTEAKVGESPVWIKNEDFQKDNLITEECMTYLKYMYYDSLEIKD